VKAAGDDLLAVDGGRPPRGWHRAGTREQPLEEETLRARGRERRSRTIAPAVARGQPRQEHHRQGPQHSPRWSTNQEANSSPGLLLSPSNRNRGEDIQRPRAHGHGVHNPKRSAAMSKREEASKDLIRRYVETWNRGDIDALAKFWTRDMIHHTRTKNQNYDDVVKTVTDFAKAFPDLRFTLDDIVAEGDRVCTRMICNATHLGAYMGVPPTGKKINCTVMGVARVVGDQIAEHWGVTDELSIMAQIGLLPQEYLAAMA
jgi:steroid delta-isomerase-like uncharacterized protein